MLIFIVKLLRKKKMNAHTGDKLDKIFINFVTPLSVSFWFLSFYLCTVHTELFHVLHVYKVKRYVFYIYVSRARVTMVRKRVVL